MICEGENPYYGKFYNLLMLLRIYACVSIYIYISVCVCAHVKLSSVDALSVVNDFCGWILFFVTFKGLGVRFL